MKKLANTLDIGVLAITLSGCAETLSFGYTAPAFARTTRLAPTTIEIDGETYEVRRNRKSISGRSKEFWAIVFEGEAFSCSQPNKEACATALADAKSGESGMGGGGDY